MPNNVPASKTSVMHWVLAGIVVAECATGLALLILPSLVGQLLLGEELSGIAVPIARVAGIALTALALACWSDLPLLVMVFYSAAVAVYLAYLGFTTGGGILLWPAVVLHVIVTLILIRGLAKGE